MHAKFLLTFGRQRQEDLYGFEASLVYRASSRPTGLHKETLLGKEVESHIDRIIERGIKLD